MKSAELSKGYSIRNEALPSSFRVKHFNCLAGNSYGGYIIGSEVYEHDKKSV